MASLEDARKVYPYYTITYEGGFWPYSVWKHWAPPIFEGDLSGQSLLTCTMTRMGALQVIRREQRFEERCERAPTVYDSRTPGPFRMLARSRRARQRKDRTVRLAVTEVPSEER